MTKFYLVETVTADKLVHQGIFYQPKEPGDTSILWIHGLTGKFYGDLKILEALAPLCELHNLGLASFNNRGHDQTTSIHKHDARKKSGYTRFPGGAGQENFTDSSKDIHAGVDFLVSQGYKRVILAGISTGANKACYYAGTHRNPHVTGVVLASPISDRLSSYKDKSEIARNLQKMERLKKQGKGRQLITDYYYPITPERYISLHKPHTPEDCFDYGDPKPKMTYFSRIRKPVFVIFSENDEVADRPVEKIRLAFDSLTNSTHYRSAVVPKGSHTYNGVEREFASEVIRWIRTIR